MAIENTEALNQLAQNLGFTEHKQMEAEETAPEPVWYEFVAETKDLNASQQNRVSRGIRELSENLT